jgi:hypothetical protein
MHRLLYVAATAATVLILQPAFAQAPAANKDYFVPNPAAPRPGAA